MPYFYFNASHTLFPISPFQHPNIWNNRSQILEQPFPDIGNTHARHRNKTQHFSRFRKGKISLRIEKYSPPLSNLTNHYISDRYKELTKF